MKKNKVAPKQYLRYMKTFMWCMRRKKDEILAVAGLKVMPFYPCDQPTLEDAIADMEHDFNLRDTEISKTDLYAMMEALKYKENDTETRSGEAGDGNQEPGLSTDEPALRSDSELLDQTDSSRTKRNRKGKKNKPE